MSDSDHAIRLKTTGRNDNCACGSGKKYKKCHLAEDERAHTAALRARHEEAVARAKATEDEDGKGDHRAAEKSTLPTSRSQKQTGSKGRGSDGPPKNIPRRGAV